VSKDSTGSRLRVRVRAADGSSNDSGWITTAHRPVGARIGEGALIAGGGIAIGILLLPIPLIHLFGIMFALTACWFGLQRARTATVVVSTGGTCPRCQKDGTFFAGFGRKRFRLPLSTSCPSCAHALTLESLPDSAPHG